jgi:hypothetical protein
MTVSWRSEFNGGDLQTFNVLWWKEFENEKECSDLVLDPGLHKYTDTTIPVTADTREESAVHASLISPVVLFLNKHHLTWKSR